MLFSLYFRKLLLLALNLKFLHKNDIFWVWIQLMKWRSSILISTLSRILKKFVILNILLQFELWLSFQCLLHSNYRMTQKLSLHHDVCHCNVHSWWNFQIFWDNFLFDVIFLHFFFTFSSKILIKINFLQKKSKNFVTQRRHVILSLKNKYNFFLYISNFKIATNWVMGNEA